jgi:hypothetical protein
MGFLDKAKAAAEQAANRANETVADVQTKRELTKAYGELGEAAFKLADAGSISHPELEAQVARIRELQAKLDEDETAAAAPESTEAVEQPLSGAGPGAA